MRPESTDIVPDAGETIVRVFTGLFFRLSETYTACIPTRYYVFNRIVCLVPAPERTLSDITVRIQYCDSFK